MMRTRVHLALCGYVLKVTRVNPAALACRSSGDGEKRCGTRPALEQLDTVLGGNRVALEQACEATDNASLVAPAHPHAEDALPPEGPSSSRSPGYPFVLGATR